MPRNQKKSSLKEVKTPSDATSAPSKAKRTRTDPLIECLVFLSRHFGQPQSAAALAAGLPMAGGRLHPDRVETAAERAGLVAEPKALVLEQVSQLELPAILLLHDDESCVLLEVSGGQGEGKTATVVMPGGKASGRRLALAELQDIYTGHAIQVLPAKQIDPRSNVVSASKRASWFWDAFTPNWWVYGQVILGTVAINLIALAVPLFIMNVYDRVIPNNAIQTLWALAIGAGIAGALDFVLRTLRGYFIDVAGRRADVVLANKVFSQVLGVRLAFRSPSSGAQANVLREFETLRDFFNSATLATFGDMPFVFLFIFVIWLVAGSLAMVPLLAVPIVILLSIVTQIPLNAVIQRAFRQAAQKNAVLFETLNGLETIKSMGAESWAADKWERSVAATIRSGMQARFLSAISANLMVGAQLFSTVAIVIVGVYAIAAGDLSQGALIAAVILNGRALAPLGQVAQVLTRSHQALIAFKAVRTLMDQPVDRPLSARFVHRQAFDGAIEFKELSFAYPGDKSAALSAVSLKIEPGERVGIVGPIGSGKSTILKLLLNLYQPSEGMVLVDGTDISQIDPADLRSQIGFMPQDVMLFHGTIRSNITLHVPEADDEQILRAAELAGALDWIKQRPLGFDQPVGERGEGLSGGQRQSVALARALVRDPPILLLDEPASNMDPRTEQLFISRLKPVLADKSLVLVTHRPAMMALVDRLLVLDRGRLVADGPKDAVLKALSGSGDRAKGGPTRVVR